MQVHTKHFIMILVSTIAMLISVILVNNAFYPIVFKEDNEASDFETTDVSPTERWKLMMQYVAFFVLFTLAFFIVFILIIYMHYKTSDAPNPVQKLKDLLNTNFIKWFALGLIGTMLIFMFYTLINKDFLVYLRLPPTTTTYGDEVPQPKMFLWLYAAATIIISIFGMILQIVTQQVNKKQKVIYFGLYVMFISILVTSLYYFMKANIPFGALFLVIYIAIFYLLYKKENLWNLDQKQA